MSAKKANIRAHVGTEGAVVDKNSANYPLLCASHRGYQNLCRLLTKTKLRVPKHTEPAARLDELEEYAAGLICLTGDENGPLAKALEQGGIEAGRERLVRLISIFRAGNIYVVLPRHFNRNRETLNPVSVS